MKYGHANIQWGRQNPPGEILEIKIEVAKDLLRSIPHEQIREFIVSEFEANLDGLVQYAQKMRISS